MLHAERLVRRRTASAVPAAVVRTHAQAAVGAAVARLAAAHGGGGAHLRALAAAGAVIGAARQRAIGAASTFDTAA